MAKFSSRALRACNELDAPTPLCNLAAIAAAYHYILVYTYYLSLISHAFGCTCTGKICAVTVL